MSARSLFMPTQDGVRLHVTLSDPHATQGVCVFIHGLGDGAFVWDASVRKLAEVYPVVTIDLRGHGDSDRSPHGIYDLHTHVADVVAVIKALRIESALIVGHSLGGQIAMHVVARELRKIVLAAVLVDICPDPNPEFSELISARLREGLRHYASVDEYRDWLLETRPLLSVSTASQLARGALRACGQGFECRLDAAVARTQRKFCAAPDWTSILAEIVCPTLVIRGAVSAMVDARAARAMARTIQHGTLVTIPAAGHAVMSDNPDGFVSALDKVVRVLLPCKVWARDCRGSSGDSSIQGACALRTEDHL